MSAAAGLQAGTCDDEGVGDVGAELDRVYDCPNRTDHDNEYGKQCATHAGKKRNVSL